MGVPAGAAAYMDAATAVPLHPVAAEALVAALADGWADPARLYSASRRAQQLRDAAHAVLAEALGVRADEGALWPSGTAGGRGGGAGGTGGAGGGGGGG